MKEEGAPTFWTVDADKRRRVDVDRFMDFLGGLRDSEFLQRNCKSIEEHLGLLAKQSNFDEEMQRVIAFLCREFRDTGNLTVLGLLKALINADLKFEARHASGDTKIEEENINMIDNNQVIALPYGPSLPDNSPPLVIACHGPQAMSDVNDQRNHSDSRTYYNQDNERVVDYLNNPFKIVKRQGISTLFSQAVQLVCNEFFEGFLDNDFEKLHPSAILELLKLLDYMSPPLFTFYLLHLAQKIAEKVCKVFEQKETERRVSKVQVEGIIYTLKNIADRWVDSDNNNSEELQWALQTRVITLFMSSQVSQKKLYAVKLLSEICRRSTYFSSKIKPEAIEAFIHKNNLLLEIYRADNHPQVITKGEEVFVYLVKEDKLDENYINVIFNLLEKCHEHVSKALFGTLQKCGLKNIENNRKILLKKIEELPRPSCFNEETFTLIESIVISTPPEEAAMSISSLYKIMQKNYEKLKQNLKSRAVITYFQVFIMGIQQNVFGHEDALLTLQPILSNPNSNLFAFMIQNFIYRLKDQYSKSIGAKCKKTLNTAIRKLLVEEKIHRLQLEDQTKHLHILQLLLQNYEELDQNLLSSDDLWILIKLDRKFSKFLKYYPEDVQISLISHLINSEDKTSYDIECVIQLYRMMNSEMKTILAPLIFKDFFSTHHLIAKYLLAPHILQINPFSIELAMSKLNSSQNNLFQALSWVILIRQILNKQDQKGFGSYPPYEYIKNSYEVTVKVTNNINQFIPVVSQIKVKSFQNLFEITTEAIKGQNVEIGRLKLKLNDQYITLNQLKEKICNIITYRYVQLYVYQTEDCEWFNKDILFEKEGAFKESVVDILKDIFYKYAEKEERLRAEHIAKIFQIATKTELISENDNRVIYIFSNYSDNGIHLRCEEWLNFYYQAALKNAPLVVENLRNLGYSDSLKGQQNFQALFSSQNIQRQALSKDGEIYNLIFTTYEKLIKICTPEQQQSVIREFVATLNLLPTSNHIKEYLSQNSTQLFLYAQHNDLYHWYISNMLQSVYHQNVIIDNYAEWKVSFAGSENFQKFLQIYEAYLAKILRKRPSQVHVNADLQIFIIQSLGRVLRGHFKEIPCLTNQNIQLAPLVLAGSEHKHIEPIILEKIPELGQLCISICRNKRNQEVAENAAAIMLDIARTSNASLKIQVIHQLIFNEQASVRQIFNSFYYLLSVIYPQLKNEYYSIHITKNSRASFKYCSEYFSVLNKLLFSEDDEHFHRQISKAYQKEISEEASLVNLADDAETDQILLGKLRILNEIKRYNPETEINSQTIVSIKEMLESSLSEEVREILYSMSSNICDLQYSLQLFISIMDSTNLKRNSLHRGKKKMGILNLGCICYINAILQQLEMIEPFRRGIIATEVLRDDVDFFREFQHIIYQLTYGQRIFLIPEGFCLNYLDYNNKPINTKEQHDADEFLNQLLDRLEFRLKDTNQRELINASFKGELVNVINCEKCYHQKERVQNFYILTVEIKSQNTLKDCLSKLIEPQIICDYFCEFCEGKVETIQKYNRFHSLPPFLFIHLQRLVFDLETFTKIKLDHPVAFPTDIDLQQFYNQEVGSQGYVLKGFVVHVGSSEGGHYYSIIKCENGWIKFDDTRIDDWDWNAGSEDRNNAYLLIYERQQSSKIVSESAKIGNPAIMKLVQDDTNYLLKEKIFLQPSFTKYLLQTLRKIYVPEEFLSNIADSAYQYNFNQAPEALQGQMDLAFDAVIRYMRLYSEMREMRIGADFSRDNDDVANKQGSELPTVAYFLICILHLRPVLAMKAIECFLHDGNGNFLQIIFMHRDKFIRNAFKFALIKVVRILIAQIYTSFLVPLPQNETINKFLQKTMLGLNQVGKNPMKMFEYFQLLLDLCKLDSRFIQWFQANKLGPKLIHFYMQKDSNLEGLLPTYPYYMSTDIRVDSISCALDVIGLLISKEPDLEAQKQETLLQRKAYLNIDLYRKVLNNRYQNQAVSRIIAYSCRNEKFNEKILTLVLQNLNRFSHEDGYIFTYIRIMYALLNIKDGFARKRIEKLLGVPILKSIGETDENRYNAARSSDRICQYWNPCFKPGDEIIFSFLELLYSNKGQHSYFTMLGILCLLNLSTTNPAILQYLTDLPSPTPDYELYFSWVNDFVFHFQKVEKEDNNSRIALEQKQKMLGQIVKSMRELQIAQEQQKPIEIEFSQKEVLTPSCFKIGKVDKYYEWQEMQFEFFDNFYLHNCDNLEQINGLTANQIVNIRFRALAETSMEEEPKCKVIQYQIDTKQRMRLFFTEFYPFSLSFQGGYYEIAIPFSKNQLQSLRVELLEEIKRDEKEKKEEKVSDERMDCQRDLEASPVRRDDIEFPTITDVYEQKEASQWNQAKMQDATNQMSIQCPFCCAKASSFSSKCPNCGEQWGVMNW